MTSLAESLTRALTQAVDYAEDRTGDPAFQTHIPDTVDVRAIRRRLCLTQEEFAGRFGFSVNTLRHWEQGSRRPEGPARAYLMVIDRAPEVVEAALLRR